MAETSWPFDSPPDQTSGFAPVYEDNWSLMAKRWHDDGVIADQGGPNLQVYGDSSAMQVKVRAGEAQVQGFHYRSDTEKFIQIPTNTGGAPRLDRIVLRVNRAANKITTERLPGTVGGTAPTLTKTTTGVYEVSLAVVTVAAGAGVAGNVVQSIAADRVTDERMFHGLRLWRPASLAALPAQGAYIWQEAVLPDGSEYRWNGSAWKPRDKFNADTSGPVLTAGSPYRSVPIDMHHWIVQYLPNNFVLVDGSFRVTQNVGGGQAAYFDSGVPRHYGEVGSAIGPIYAGQYGHYTLVNRGDQNVFGDENG